MVNHRQDMRGVFVITDDNKIEFEKQIRKELDKSWDGLFHTREQQNWVSVQDVISFLIFPYGHRE